MMRRHPLERQAPYLLFGLIVITWTTRLLHLPTKTGDWDAIDFALALGRFDLLSMQPHFPGYPVFIAAAKLLQLWVGSPIVTLAAVSGSFGALSLIPLYGFALHLTGQVRTALLAACLFALNPLLTLTSVQPMSESMGMFFLLMVLWVSSASLIHPEGDPIHLRLLLLAAFLFALGMGVRVSYFPIGAACLFPLWRLPRRARWRALLTASVTAAATVLAWLLPMAAFEGGLLGYLKLGAAFTKGHFYDWGGTAAAMTGDSASMVSAWLERLYLWVWVQGIGAGLTGSLPADWQLGGAYLLLFSAAAAGSYLYALRKHHSSTQRGYLLLVILPYSLWVLLGQNPEKPRHILPYLPFACLAIAVAIRSLPWHAMKRAARAAWVGAVLLYAVFATQQAYSLVQATAAPSPVLQLVHFAEEHIDPSHSVLFTWEEQRAFQYYAPQYLVTRVQSYEYFQRLLGGHQASNRKILLTSKVVEGFAQQGHSLTASGQLVELASFEGHPVVHPVYGKIRLYEFQKSN